MLPNETFWRDVENVPKLKSAHNIIDYYTWYDGIQNAVNSGLTGGWGFATGSISYPSLTISNLTEAGRGSSMYPALKRVSDEGLSYIMTRLPMLQGQDNYTEWRGSIHVFMDAKGLYGYCDGSIQRPAEGEAQSLDITPTLSDALENGLRNWRQGKLDNLLDDQKMWLLADKLTLCALYTTCCAEIQRNLSHCLDQNELKTSCDVLQYIDKQYGPPRSTFMLHSQLQNVKRGSYDTFQEFARAFRYTIRAYEAADPRIQMSFVITQFCCALGDGDENGSTIQAVVQFINERQQAGQDMSELKLEDVIAIAERTDEMHLALQPTSRRSRNRTN